MSVFVEVLEWAVHGPTEMVHRLPEEGSTDIKMGAQLIVQENQRAIFVRDGKYLDEIGPGRHVLSTLNLPVLTRALSLPFGFHSPFRAAVLFVNGKVFTDLKWGTRNPVAFRDRELGLVRLRGYGRFSLRVADPLLFLNTLVGSRAEFRVTELEDYLRDVIVARLNDLLGEQLQSLFDLPALYNEIGAAAKVRLREDVRRYGLELVEFYVNAITPPDPVQRMIDERSGLGAVGDLNDFLRFEAARAIGGHAAGGGDNGANGANGAGGGGTASTAGHAMEAGVGAGIGLSLVPGLLAARPAAGGAAAGTAPAPAPAHPASDPAPLTCGKCQAVAPATSNYCSACGESLLKPERAARCGRCRAALSPQAWYCGICGAPVTRPDAPETPKPER